MNHTRRLIGTGLLATASLASACQDNGTVPTGNRQLPPVPTVEDGASTNRIPVLSGAIVMTMRDFGAGPSKAAELRSQSGNYETPFGETSSGDGTVSVGTNDVSMRLFIASSAVKRQGRWTVDGGRGRDGHERSLRFEASGGAPPSLVELTRGSLVVGRIATTWTRVAGGWRVLNRSISIVRDGAEVRTTAFAFGEPEVTVARKVRSTSAALVPGDGPLSPSFEDDGNPCQREIDAMEDAFVIYEGAVASLLSCLAGPWSCLASTIGAFVAAARYDNSFHRAIRCLDAI